MDTILNGVADEARAIHAEYKKDYGTGREYVRIWKCVDAQPYTSKGSRDFSGRVSRSLLGIKNLDGHPHKLMARHPKFQELRFWAVREK